ncbi:MAG: 16S rRNA (uracil(1498)-N(3))-methyltransferase [Anaerolineaceae bacterium]
MNRFFIAPEHILPGEVNFPEDTGHQINRVLRLKIGEQVVVLDNLGSEYEVELTGVTGHRVFGRILKQQAAPPEPLVRLYLYLCLSQREKFELMLQKCTEIGAAGFIPVISSRSLVQEREDKGSRRQDRWKRILREAAEQSGRGRIPLLFSPRKFPSAAAEAVKTHDRVLIPSPALLGQKPGQPSLRQALAGFKDGGEEQEIAVFIGPEGGFSDEELELARQAGCRPVDLGRRVLRMETAAMVVTALILHEIGEME